MKTWKKYLFIYIPIGSLGVYTINIGDRQKGRVRGNSVIDVVCDKNLISQALNRVIDVHPINKA